MRDCDILELYHCLIGKPDGVVWFDQFDDKMNDCGRLVIDCVKARTANLQSAAQ
nr:hypothetical protein [Phyllobacterium zundukense]